MLYCVIRTSVLSFTHALKLLNITLIFVYHTVKLFLDMGGLSDRKRSDWPSMVCTP